MKRERALAEFKPIVFDELMRSGCPIWRELAWVLEIGCLGTSNEILDIEQLEQLLQPGMTSDRDVVRFAVVTRVLPDPTKIPHRNIVSQLESFLREHGGLQERVLTARALITKFSKDGDAEEIEDISRPEFIHKRALQLAGCLADKRSVLIDAIVNAVYVWVNASATLKQGWQTTFTLEQEAIGTLQFERGPAETDHLEQPPKKNRALSETERRRIILRKHIRRQSDLRDSAKVAAAFAELDSSKIRLPQRVVVDNRGRRKRKPREGTWTEQLKYRKWYKLFGQTLRRDLFKRKTAHVDGPSSISK